MKRVTVHVPATSANLGPGFDILGIALKHFNEVRFEADVLGSAETKPGAVTFGIHGEGVTELPRDASNLVTEAAYRVFRQVKKWPKTLHVTLVNRIPLSRGLGSSAAATVGGMVGANALLGKPLTEDELLQMAVDMEGHPDNVVPAFKGGLCASGIFDRVVRFFKTKAPKDLQAVVCSPDQPLSTAKARGVLPTEVPFRSAVFTGAHVAFILGAFAQKRYEWLAFAMDDVLHQKPRARLMPGLLDAIAAAKKAGAYGSALSGAGSSVLAFCKPSDAAAVGIAFESALRAKGVESRSQTMEFDNDGMHVFRS